MSEFTDRLAAIAAVHAATQTAIDSVLTPEALELAKQAAEDHAAIHFQNHLEADVPADEAMRLAIEEAARHEQHIVDTLTFHANPKAVKQSLSCAVCAAATEHVLTVDRFDEIIATCRCGRFQKFPAGHDFSA